MISPEHVQLKLQELENQIQALGGEILVHVDYAIEAIEHYQKDPGYYDKLVRKRDEMRQQIRALTGKAQEIR